MQRNWSGTHEYTAPRIVAASSVEDVQRAISAGGPVHALGTRHSFTDLPDTTGTLLDLSGLTGGFALDQDARTVTVAAGTRYGELALWLDQQGYALHNLGSLPHISVGGATATGTHGSGNANGVLTSAVRSIRYVGADGDVHEVRQGEPDFDALAVGVGAFGVLVSLDTRDPAHLPCAAGRLPEHVVGCRSGAVRRDHRCRLQRVGVHAVGPRSARRRVGEDPAGRGRGPRAGVLLDGTRVIDANPLEGLPDLTVLGGVPGPWMERLPHFRLDGQPSFGDEIQSEYFVARSDAPAALRAVRELAPLIQPCCSSAS